MRELIDVKASIGASEKTFLDIKNCQILVQQHYKRIKKKNQFYKKRSMPHGGRPRSRKRLKRKKAEQKYTWKPRKTNDTIFNGENPIFHAILPHPSSEKDSSYAAPGILGTSEMPFTSGNASTYFLGSYHTNGSPSRRIHRLPTDTLDILNYPEEDSNSQFVSRIKECDEEMKEKNKMILLEWRRQGCGKVSSQRLQSLLTLLQPSIALNSFSPFKKSPMPFPDSNGFFSRSPTTLFTPIHVNYDTVEKNEWPAKSEKEDAVSLDKLLETSLEEDDKIWLKTFLDQLQADVKSHPPVAEYQKKFSSYSEYLTAKLAPSHWQQAAQLSQMEKQVSLYRQKLESRKNNFSLHKSHVKPRKKNESALSQENANKHYGKVFTLDFLESFHRRRQAVRKGLKSPPVLAPLKNENLKNASSDNIYAVQDIHENQKKWETRVGRALKCLLDLSHHEHTAMSSEVKLPPSRSIANKKEKALVSYLEEMRNTKKEIRTPSLNVLLPIAQPSVLEYHVRELDSRNLELPVRTPARVKPVAPNAASQLSPGDAFFTPAPKSKGRKYIEMENTLSGRIMAKNTLGGEILDTRRLENETKSSAARLVYNMTMSERRFLKTRDSVKPFSSTEVRSESENKQDDAMFAQSVPNNIPEGQFISVGQVQKKCRLISIPAKRTTLDLQENNKFRGINSILGEAVNSGVNHQKSPRLNNSKESKRTLKVSKKHNKLAAFPMGNCLEIRDRKDIWNDSPYAVKLLSQTHLHLNPTN